MDVVGVNWYCFGISGEEKDSEFLLDSRFGCALPFPFDGLLDGNEWDVEERLEDGGEIGATSRGCWGEIGRSDDPSSLSTVLVCGS